MDKKTYELTGELYHIAQTQTFDSGFSKREIVIKTADNPQYPQFIKLELHKDKVTAVDGMRVGQTVDVAFDLSGREYNGKYYTNLICWRIKVNTESGATAEQDDLPMGDDDDNVGF